MSAAPAPGPPATGPVPPTQSDQQPQQGGAVATAFMSLTGIASILFYIVFGYGAAKLSYDKFGSVGWAILDFIFATFYYPYYAIFLSGPTSSFGGRRRR
jgi:hypothetical protein